jgi:hypothetical protein
MDQIESPAGTDQVSGGAFYSSFSSSRKTRGFSRGIRAQKGKLTSSWVQSRDEE